MARKQGFQGSFSQLNTRGAGRRTSQEDLDASRAQAAGKEPPPYDPAEHARLGRQMEDASKRWMMGRYENKGRSPMFTLSPHQFDSFQKTGAWSGEPQLPADYGPSSAVPEDKEYEKDW